MLYQWCIIPDLTFLVLLTSNNALDQECGWSLILATKQSHGIQYNPLAMSFQLQGATELAYYIIKKQVMHSYANHDTKRLCRRIPRVGIHLISTHTVL
jgi:ADP-dependent phosphofructokinase/glucokinase